VKRLKSRRLWVVITVVAALILVGRWLDRLQLIQSYRVVDDRTIAVQVDSSSPQWTRITSVVETHDRVTVSVGSFIFPLAPVGGWRWDERGVAGDLESADRQPICNRRK
jgi:EamA domain-containing membrane protein RarD